MTDDDTPTVILLPDGAVLLTYPDGSALRIERDGGVSLMPRADECPSSRQSTGMGRIGSPAETLANYPHQMTEQFLSA